MTVRIIHGHVLDVLATLPESSVHCIWTSIPYFGLRSYGTEPQTWPCGWRGEHGLEPSLAVWLENEVAIWRALKRVLRNDGVAWLNVGDSYAGGGRGGNLTEASSTLEGGQATQRASMVKRGSKPPPELKQKQRMMLPARLALALQDDGWWVRDEIVWAKPNPMPSSVEDRTTPAHEMLYMMTKRARYFYDREAIAEPFAESSIARLSQPTIMGQQGGEKQDAFDLAGLNDRSGSRRPNEIVQGLSQKITRKPAGWDDGEGSNETLRHARGKSGNSERKFGADRGRPHSHLAGSVPWEGTTRNKRSVWTIATEPFPDAHFATAPTSLVEPCIKAGCPRGGLVLDPFFGSGTTGLVADRLNRDCVGIELNPEYIEMAKRRLSRDAPLLTEVA